MRSGSTCDIYEVLFYNIYFRVNLLTERLKEKVKSPIAMVAIMKVNFLREKKLFFVFLFIRMVMGNINLKGKVMKVSGKTI